MSQHTDDGYVTLYFEHTPAPGQLPGVHGRF